MIWLILRVRIWYRGDTDAMTGDELLLVSVKELRRLGDVSEEEYRSIKGRLAARMHGTSQAESPNSNTSEKDSQEETHSQNGQE